MSNKTPIKITKSKADGFWLHIGPVNGLSYSMALSTPKGGIGRTVLNEVAEDLDKKVESTNEPQD